MQNLIKMGITIDFNGSLDHLSDVINNWLVNVAVTFTDILKHYFLQICML